VAAAASRWEGVSRVFDGSSSHKRLKYVEFAAKTTKQMVHAGQEGLDRAEKYKHWQIRKWSETPEKIVGNFKV